MFGEGIGEQTMSATKLAFAAALIFASPAVADNLRRHDRTIEKAAAKRAAERIGDLRGSIGPAAHGNPFFEDVEPVPLGFGLPRMAPQKGHGYPPPISFRFEFMDLASAQRWQE